jgi:anti-sigma regulatory factor (Ser/Thr protein kinase)
MILPYSLFDMNKTINRQSISVHNTTADCSKLSDFLAEYVSANNISDEVHNDLRLVLEEAFVNIASYAFIAGKTHKVSIELSNTANTVSITFIDDGIAFNPLLDRDIQIDTEDHCEGGMGIHIIKSLTDQQVYDRIENRNVFTVTKHYTM